jgi:plastocyanin
MKMKVVIGGVILAGILAIGALWWQAQSSGVAPYTPPAVEPAGGGVTGAASASDDPYSVTITLTDEGFTPRDTTVAQGTRVRFLNDSKDTFWPASGVHPTHTLYPEKEPTDCLGSAFDACKALAPGQFYDFTFYYVGRWPYHDHLHAYNTGSVTVTASTST